MVASRVEAAARHRGFEMRQARTEKEVEQALQDRPALLLVSTQYARVDWESLLARLHDQADAPPVLAFGPHMDLEQRERALRAGVSKWVPNSKIATDLPQLLDEMTS